MQPNIAILLKTKELSGIRRTPPLIDVCILSESDVYLLISRYECEEFENRLRRLHEPKHTRQLAKSCLEANYPFNVGTKGKARTSIKPNCSFSPQLFLLAEVQRQNAGCNAGIRLTINQID